MGLVVAALHERPVLTRAMLEEAIADADFNAFLADSDLANEIEQVKLSQLSFNLEELSKLWSVFFQIPYRLSLPYVASLVFIDQPADADARPAGADAHGDGRALCGPGDPHHPHCLARLAALAQKRHWHHL